MIDSFHGEYRWLSNFYPSPIEMDGHVYATVEHAYQAAKTDDPDGRRFVREARTPGASKIRGRAVKCKANWDDIKVSVMLTLLRRKFEAHPDLESLLLATAPMTLIEGNTWGDTFWGICRGKGENHLGRLLMQVRTELAMPNDLRDLLG